MSEDPRTWTAQDAGNAALYGLCMICGAPRHVTVALKGAGLGMEVIEALVCSRDPAHAEPDVDRPVDARPGGRPLGPERRDMTGHTHDEFPVDLPDSLGRPVDGRLLGQFISAAFDGCTSCQDALLTLLVEDAATTARLVELACVATQGILGGLPASMTDEGEGLSSPEFCRLARAGVDGGNDVMWRACGRMTIVERRAAANTAADTLVGILVTPP
jgi:hypothetical protein